MIAGTGIGARSLHVLGPATKARRYSLGPPLVPRVPYRRLWVVRSGGHVFAKFSEQEREDWKMPPELHFGAGAEYQDNDGRTRRKGRLRKQEEPWVETTRIHVGDIDTLEKATLVRCMVAIIEQSDYEPAAFNCINATDAIVATVRGKPPLAPEGTDMMGRAGEYMQKLAELEDSPPAGEITFHLPKS